MQLPEDSVRTRSSPLPSLSLSLSSLALCLAGSFPFQAQSRSGPVGTSYNTTSATFYKKDWAWISWAWTFTMAVDLSKKSTSMSGWVLLNEMWELSAAPQQSPCAVFVELVHPCLFRNCTRVQQQSRTSSAVFIGLPLAKLTCLRGTEVDWKQQEWLQFNTLKPLSKRSHLLCFGCTIFYVQFQQQSNLSSSHCMLYWLFPSVFAGCQRAFGISRGSIGDSGWLCEQHSSDHPLASSPHWSLHFRSFWSPDNMSTQVPHQWV